GTTRTPRSGPPGHPGIPPSARAWMTLEKAEAARIVAAVLDRRRRTSGASRTSRTPHGGTAAHEQPTQPAVRGPGTTRSAPAAVRAAGGLRARAGAAGGEPGAPAR